MKKLLVIIMALIMVFTMASCGGNSEKAEPQGDASSKDLYAVVNGQEVRLGDSFDEIREGLGEEAKPAEEVEPCDGDTDWLKTIHFYNGISIHHNKDGIVENIDINTYDVGEGDALFMGSVKLGDSVDSIKEIFGEPRQEDEWSMDYMIGDVYLLVMKAEEGSDTIGEINFHPDGVM